MALAACSCAPAAPVAPPLLEALAPGATGVTFTNVLPEQPDFNIVDSVYYNGGVAARYEDVRETRRPRATSDWQRRSRGEPWRRGSGATSCARAGS